MKRISLLAATVVPLAVSAGDKDLANWDYSKLEDNKRVSQIMDAEVYTKDGREIANVRDVAFTRDGSMKLVIESNGRLPGSDPDVAEEAGFEGRHSMTDNPSSKDNTNYQATDDFPRTRGLADTQARIATLDWHDVNFDAGREAIVVESQQVEFGDQAVVETERAMDSVAIAEERGEQGVTVEQQTRPIANRDAPIARGEDSEGTRDLAGDVLASDLLGMDVNLANDESFGRIEDVLVDDNGEAQAFVVDSWDLVDKQRYAIPADISAVDTGSGELNLDYAEEEFDDLEEFDFADIESNRM